MNNDQILSAETDGSNGITRDDALMIKRALCAVALCEGYRDLPQLADDLLVAFKRVAAALPSSR
jgi:hypothetical protein